MGEGELLAGLARRALLLLVECGEQGLRLGVITEGLADMDKAVDIAGAEDEAAAELERVLAEAVLAHADGFGALAGAGVVRPQEVKQVGFLKAELAIGDALVINQERERDAGLLAEVAGITHIAQADGGKAGAALPELLLKLAQLRDVLTAEDSTVVSQKDDHGRRISPQRAECHGLALDIRQGNAGESGAVAFSHGGTLSVLLQACVKRGEHYISSRR